MRQAVAGENEGIHTLMLEIYLLSNIFFFFVLNVLYASEIMPNVGLRIEYPSNLEESARSIMPSRSAVIAMIILDMSVDYSIDEVTGAFIINASESQAWKERVTSSSP